MIGVKSFIKFNKLNCQQLLQDKIIPYPKNFLNVENKKHKSFVKNNNAYSFYGSYIDYLLRHKLANNYICEVGNERKGLPINFKINYQEVAKSVHQNLCEKYNYCDIFSWENIDMSEIDYMLSLITKQFNSPYLKEIRFNDIYQMKINKGFLIGRPDIVTKECILEIKCSGNFSNMAEESYLQLLSYYVMKKEEERMNKISSNIKYIGLVLPLQSQIKLLNLQKWDYGKFLKLFRNN